MTVLRTPLKLLVYEHIVKLRYVVFGALSFIQLFHELDFSEHLNHWIFTPVKLGNSFDCNQLSGFDILGLDYNSKGPRSKHAYWNVFAIINNLTKLHLLFDS